MVFAGVTHRKGRKSSYNARKQEVLRIIERIHHDTEGKPGHRSMMIFLARKGVFLSKTTIHKYMNKELSLTSIVRRKRPGYVKGKPHKVFPNLLNQNFTAHRANQLRCTDFTYLFLKDGRKRYNCSIIDLYDRSIVASVSRREITSQGKLPCIRTGQGKKGKTLISKSALLCYFEGAA